MKKLSLFSLFIFVLALSCSEDSNSPIISPHNTDELIPLKIGNSWVHNSTYYEGSEEHSVKATSTVVSEEMYNGEKYFRMEYFNSNNNQKEIIPLYFINKYDGHYILFFDDTYEPETEFIKYPVTEGEIFRTEEYSKFYIEKVDTVIRTRAGKFKCIKYVKIIQKGGKNIDKSITYYCPGIGQIAGEMIWINEETGTQYLYLKSELVSYTVE